MNITKEILLEFLKFSIKKLKIKTPYNVYLTPNRGKEFKTYAYYDPHQKVVKVYTKNRSCADVLRSVAHELVHHKQNEENRLLNLKEIPDVGGEIEDEANAIAGQIIKEFGYSTKYNIYD